MKLILGAFLFHYSMRNDGKRKGYWTKRVGLHALTLMTLTISSAGISLQDFHGWHTLAQLKECESNRVIRPKRNSSTLTCWFQISMFERFKQLPGQIIPARAQSTWSIFADGWLTGGKRSPFRSAGFQFKIQVEARAADYQDQARHLATRPTITSVLSMQTCKEWSIKRRMERLQMSSMSFNWRLRFQELQEYPQNWYIYIFIDWSSI